VNISATIIADSRNTRTGDRITTFHVRFPRVMLADLNTHRALSRNGASNRAISAKRRIRRIEDDPYVPEWYCDARGMASRDHMDADRARDAAAVWQAARADAPRHARALAELGAHRELVNALLEPFQWHEGLVTATDRGNFFTPRTATIPAAPVTLAAGEGVAVFRTEVEPDDDHDPYSTHRERPHGA